MIEANPCFLQKKTKKYTLAVFCQQQNISSIKLDPGTYQLFLLPGMKRACTHIRLCIQPKSGKIDIDFFIIIIS